MQKLTCLLLLCYLLLPVFSTAQNAPLYLSFEGGGNGLIASANIGRPIIINQRFKVNFQTGLGWAPKIAKPQSVFTIPGQLTCNFGENGMYLEAGAGLTLIPKSKLHTGNWPTEKVSCIFLRLSDFGMNPRTWFGRIYACPLFHINGEHIYRSGYKRFYKFRYRDWDNTLILKMIF